jgi:hypothetical protein
MLLFCLGVCNNLICVMVVCPVGLGFLSTNIIGEAAGVGAA